MMKLNCSRCSKDMGLIRDGNVRENMVVYCAVCDAAMLRELEDARMGDMLADHDATCKWQYDDTDEKWESDCGAAWVFSEGGIKGNGFEFCHRCGKRIVEEIAK